MTETAFQANAFQTTGFQIVVVRDTDVRKIYFAGGWKKRFWREVRAKEILDPKWKP